ncbi:MAG: RDD family protein [Cycloclasticus sp.]
MTDIAQSPGFFKRLAVIVYDLLLLLAVLFVATLALLPFQQNNTFEPNSWLFSAYLVLVSFLFYGWFWTTGGQTLGLLAWKLRVANPDGQSISWQQAAIRFVTAIFSWGVFGLGFVWILFNKERLSWHDIASNSRVSFKPKD